MCGKKLNHAKFLQWLDKTETGRSAKWLCAVVFLHCYDIKTAKNSAI